jgi:hypothetical protein
VWSQIVHNHVYIVPPRLVSVVGSYLWARDDHQGTQ